MDDSRSGACYDGEHAQCRHHACLCPCHHTGMLRGLLALALYLAMLALYLMALPVVFLTGALTNAGDRREDIGPWFSAGYDGECDECGEPFDAGDEIRAVPSGYEARQCVDEHLDTGPMTLSPPRRDYSTPATTLDEMGL